MTTREWVWEMLVKGLKILDRTKSRELLYNMVTIINNNVFLRTAVRVDFEYSHHKKMIM